MTSRFPKPLIAAIATLILGLATALAEPYAKGSEVESFTTIDQHEKEFVFDPKSTKFLLVSHDMDSGKKANVALNALGKDFLHQHKAVFLSNIHGMPGVGRMFALPKMRKYAHQIVLADDAALIARFPATAGKVTLLKLANGKVSEVSTWDPAAEKIEELLK
ncbi:MAG TPA: hypothetical protein VFY13_01075 [Luteolibacter sp.]|nr:hypothetical protein [Luteolibacter sp.]